jgi:hypothetical protein
MEDPRRGMRPGTMLAGVADRMAAEGHVSRDDREDYWVLDWTQQSAAPKRGVSVGIYNESTLADLYHTLNPNKKAPPGDGGDRAYDETYARLLKLPEAELAAFWRKHLHAASDVTRRQRAKGPHHAGSTVLMNLIADGECERALSLVRLSTPDYLNSVSELRHGARGVLNELAAATWGAAVPEGEDGPRVRLLGALIEAGLDVKNWRSALPPLFEACSNPATGEPFLQQLLQAGARTRCAAAPQWGAPTEQRHDTRAGQNIAMAAASCFHLAALRWLLSQPRLASALCCERAAWPALSTRSLCALEVAVEQLGVEAAPQQLAPDSVAAVERGHAWLRELLGACAAAPAATPLHPAFRPSSEGLDFLTEDFGAPPPAAAAAAAAPAAPAAPTAPAAALDDGALLPPPPPAAPWLSWLRLEPPVESGVQALARAAPRILRWLLAQAAAEAGGIAPDALLPVEGRLQPCWPAHIVTCPRGRLLKTGGGVGALNSQALARLQEAKWSAYGTTQLCLASCLDLAGALGLAAIAAMRCSRGEPGAAAPPLVLLLSLPLALLAVSTLAHAYRTVAAEPRLALPLLRNSVWLQLRLAAAVATLLALSAEHGAPIPVAVAPELLGLAALLSWLQLVQLGWLWPQGCAALALFLDAARCLPSALALAAPAALGGFVAGLAFQCFDAYPDDSSGGGGAGGGGGMLRMARATCQWLLLPIAFVLAAGLAASSPYSLAHRAELERSRCLLWRDLSLGPEELRAVSARVRGTAW